MIHARTLRIMVVYAFLCPVSALYAEIPWLHVDGNRIRDPEGNVVVLRGISLIDLGYLEGWQGGAINMIDRITDENDSQGSSPGWYPKILRIPVYPPDSVDDWPHQWNPNSDDFYNDLLRPVVDYCAEKDLYVIIDWHYVGNTWDKVAQTCEFWEYMASRFASDSHVLFELFGEPINQLGSDTENWLSVRTDMSTWVDVVRTYAPYNLILVAGPTWSQAIGPAANYRLSDNNIVMVSHIYPGHWRNPSWCQEHIRSCAAVYPILLTEWGFSEGHHPGSGDLLCGTISDYGRPLMDFIEGLGIGNTACVASHNWGPPMFHGDWTLRCGEREMGCFVKDTLYEKRNDDLPHGAIRTPVDAGTPSTEGFETNDLGGFPWSCPGDAGWETTRRHKHSGSYCAKSGSIDHDESATLQVTLQCVSGNITFYCRVSSEQGSDHLKFSIDGAEEGKWSGEQDWTQVSFPVDEGTRTFEWTYVKNGSGSNGDDAAWIDDIVFPSNTSDGGGTPLPNVSAEITTWQDNKRGACSFTFDDNLRTQLSHFAPKFVELGFVGTFFLITGDWALGTVYDSYSQYVALVDLGWEIGSHTVNHPHLRGLSSPSLEHELADSRATLEALFDLSPGLTLAYPYTESDTRVRDMTAQYYIAARGGRPKSISPDMSQWSSKGYDAFSLPSYGWAAGYHDLDAMNDATDQAIAREEWIVEMIHGTEGEGWEPPDWATVYEPHLEYVKSKEPDLWVDTFGNVYRYIAERHACRVSVQLLDGGIMVVLTSDSTLPPTPVPVTVKIDVPDHWHNVVVTDNGHVLSGRVMTENANKWCLVNTIPAGAPKEICVFGDTTDME